MNLTIISTLIQQQQQQQQQEVFSFVYTVIVTSLCSNYNAEAHWNKAT